MSAPNIRERGLRLQRRVTVAAVAGATVLAGVFAGIAAATAPGHKAVRRIVGGGSSAAVQQQPSQSFDDSQTPIAPAQVPSQSYQPPVASSGGS